MSEPLYSNDALHFLHSNILGVLSAVGADHQLQSRPVYYVSDSSGHIFILTKSGTEKIRTLYANDTVAFVCYNADTYQSLQILGTASIEGDRAIKDSVFDKITKLKDRHGQPVKLPITTFHEGGFVILRITPTSVKYTDFGKKLSQEN